LHPNS
jgi:chaperonin cofactor prefoldin